MRAHHRAGHRYSARDARRSEGAHAAGNRPPREARTAAPWRGGVLAGVRPNIVALTVLAALGAALALVAILEFRDCSADRGSANERARLFAVRDTDDAAAHIDRELDTFAVTIRELAGALGDGSLDRAGVPAALTQRLATLHNVSGIAVAFEPGTDDGGVSDAPLAIRRHGRVVLDALAGAGDAGYTTLAWYAGAKASGEAGWAAPLPVDGSAMRAAYAAPFTLPGQAGAGFGGVVLGSYEIGYFAYEPAWHDLAADGYVFVVGAAGQYLEHPLASWVGRPLDPGATCGTDAALASCGQLPAFATAAGAATAGERTLIQLTDPLTLEPAWLLVAPIPGPQWTLGAVVLERSLLTRTADQQRALVRGGIAALAAAALMLLVALRVDRVSQLRLWLAAVVVSAAALGGISWIWYLELTTPATVASDASGTDFLEQITPYRGLGAEEVHAGAFVQSIEFTGANDVQVTGTVWQVFRGQTAEERGIEPGFHFPEAESVTLDLLYDVQTDAGQQIGWGFTMTLREVFDHRQYPFDQEDVWIRMRPREMTVPVLLLPDVPSYELLAPSSLPGVADDILVEGWRVNDSFFSYRLNTYNANFSPLNLIDADAGDLMPELYFNVLISRLFINPFVSNMVPLMVVLLLLFAVLVLTTRHEERKQVFGFSTIGVLGYCTGLFFVVILAHNQLRNSLGAGEVIYLEQ